jgi:hypothetical protein
MAEDFRDFPKYFITTGDRIVLGLLMMMIMMMAIIMISCLPVHFACLIYNLN